MGRLSGKVAFITGAGSGIGRASAARFVEAGAQVVVAELDQARGESVAHAIGESALFVSTDVKDEESVRAALAEGARVFGKITALVTCAGGSVVEDRAVTDVDMSVWDHTIDLDLKGAFLTCRHGIGHLIESGGGSIVNFTSIVALKGAFQGHVYTAAKGGIISFTQALAGRYWRNGIRANAIAPGIVLSDRVASRMDVDTAAAPEDQIAKAMDPDNRLVDDRHPFGYGVPDDIAQIALFLASDESRMVNGAVIPAEGGASAY